MPEISVIIPVYNAEKYLRQCLESVVNQTFSDLEIICVDDGSSDNSYKILQEYKNKDNRFILIKQKNLYAGIARNSGLKVATGKYVHFLDADDWLELNAYEKLLKIIKEKDTEIVKFCGYSFDDETLCVSDTPYMSIKRVEDRYFDNYLSFHSDTENVVMLPDSCWSGLYLREFLVENNITFDDCRYINDTQFFFHCVINAKRIYLSPEKLIYYRQNVTGSVVTKRARHFECFINLINCCNKIFSPLNKHEYNLCMNKIISSTFGWYNICGKNSGFFVKQKLDRTMNKILKLISGVELNEKNKKRAEELKYSTRNKLFSVIKIKNYLVITILAITIKHGLS